MAGSERRRHRSLIDVIQDLEQENAAEIASSGVSPASDRPVPLDLSGAISEPTPIPSTSGQHAQGQALEQPPALPPSVPHHLRPSDDGSEPVPCPPGKTMYKQPETQIGSMAVRTRETKCQGQTQLLGCLYNLRQHICSDAARPTLFAM